MARGYSPGERVSRLTAMKDYLKIVRWKGVLMSEKKKTPARLSNPMQENTIHPYNKNSFYLGLVSAFSLEKVVINWANIPLHWGHRLP